MRRAQLSFILAVGVFAVLHIACGGGGDAVLPAAPVHDVPAGGDYWVVGQVTLLAPVGDETFAADCNGVAIAPGTVLPFLSNLAGGGLEFQAGGGGDPCGDPALASLLVAGTDEAALLGFYLQAPGLQVNSLPAPPVMIDQFWEGGVNIDITCPRTSMSGTPMTLYPTNDSWPRAGDELVLEAFELEEFDTGRWQFVPGSAIEGRFTYTGRATMQLGGREQKARALIEGCFRIPAACPVQAFGGIPALCP